MLSSSRLISRTAKRRFAFILVAMIAITALAVSARAWRTAAVAHEMSTMIAESRNDSLVAAQATLGSTPDRLEAELVKIRPTGFEPAEITRPAGRFILAFQNSSGLEELLLQIEAGRDRRRDVRMPWEKIDWNDVLDLPAGSYTVTEANHPDWIFRLTLTAR
jgi:hypothetical protein